MPGIVINIEAGETLDVSKVTCTGQHVDIIADSERASFGIGTDDDLKGAVGKYLSIKPSYAYLKSPASKDDLYKKYGWRQVQRILVPKKAEILKVSTKPTNLNTVKLNNVSDKVGIYTANVLSQVTDSVSSTWTDSKKVSFDQTIKLEVSVLAVNGSSDSKIGFEKTWGNTETVSKQSSVSMGAGVSVELKPKESAMVYLSASTGTMSIRITYEARLEGRVVSTYNSIFRGNKCWSTPIENIIGKSKKVQIVQDVQVAFYSNATVNVTNAISNEKMPFFISDHPDESPSEEFQIQ